MMDPTPTHVLKALPKTTPLWAVGVVSVIVSFSVGLSAIYILSRSEVQQYLQNVDKSAVKNLELEETTLNSMIKLVTETSTQVTNLSIVLNQTQQQNTKLAERVSRIEADHALSNVNLAACEKALAECSSKGSSG